MTSQTEKDAKILWRVSGPDAECPDRAVLLYDTPNCYRYKTAIELQDGQWHIHSKPVMATKHVKRDMRFFENELAAIDYLASLMIREQEKARQTVLSWQDRLNELKQQRDLLVARGDI